MNLWSSGLPHGENPLATRTFSLAFLGDVMLGRGVSRALRDHDADWFWGDALPLLQQADFVLANLELPITSGGQRWREEWKAYRFRADPMAIEILRRAGVGFVCLANNHALDYGADGLLDTLRLLDEAGIRHAGAGATLADAAKPVVIPLPGLRIGVLAGTDNMRAFAAAPMTPGTHLRHFDNDPESLGWVEAGIEALRQQQVDLIALTLHWGPNMRLTPSRRFQRFARAAIDLGVDVIHGHSAHVVQGVERHGDGLILYDTGNVIDDYWKFPFRRDDWSFLFFLDLADGRQRRLRLVPLRLHPRPLCLARGDTFTAICNLMRKRCAALGTELTGTAEGLELPL